MIAFLLALLVAVPLPPAPSKYVTDRANVIADDRELQLNETLARFDRETTNQILVYVDRRIPEGTTLEEMGAQAIRTWGVGQKKKDNGAILFLFVDDRQSRIEVGYGLEEHITDAKSKRILVAMRDALRAGDYAKAVDDATASMMTTIRAPASGVAAARRLSPALIVSISVALLMVVGAIVAIVFARRRSRGSSSSSSGWEALSSLSSSSSSSSSSWSSSDSSSSSSSSSSDFSSGGGDGGGGGASDRW